MDGVPVPQRFRLMNKDKPAHMIARHLRIRLLVSSLHYDGDLVDAGRQHFFDQDG